MISISFKKSLLLFLALGSLLILAQDSYGQILKDRGKLNTVKREGRGFVLFERKIRTESDRKKAGKKKRISTRTTSGRRVVRLNRVRPGFSTPLFGARIRSVSPRFSKKRFVAGNPTAGISAPAKRKVRKKLVSPRFSRKGREAVTLAQEIRYSAKAGRKKKSVVTPRFSRKAREAVTLAQEIRYSAKPGRKKKAIVTPRFSRKAREAVTLAQEVRYTAKPGRKKKVLVTPRFSHKAREAVTLAVPPRYSATPKRGKKLRISPLYSDSKNRNVKVLYRRGGYNLLDYLLAIPAGVVLGLRPYNEQIGLFKGRIKQKDVEVDEKAAYRGYQGESKREIKLLRNYRAKRRSKNYLAYSGEFKRRTALFRKVDNKFRSLRFSGLVLKTSAKRKNQKPNYNLAKLDTRKRQTKTTKNLLKRINRFRTKVDGNKAQPPSVRGRNKKLKFDKKEKGLWYE